MQSKPPRVIALYPLHYLLCPTPPRTRATRLPTATARRCSSAAPRRRRSRPRRADPQRHRAFDAAAMRVMEGVRFSMGNRRWSTPSSGWHANVVRPCSRRTRCGDFAGPRQEREEVRCEELKPESVRAAGAAEDRGDAPAAHGDVLRLLPTLEDRRPRGRTARPWRTT